MILSLAVAVALQGVAAFVGPDGRPAVLSVRVAGAAHATRVPLVTRPDGRLAVRADVLTDALGGSTRRMSNGHFAVTLPGVTLEMSDQSGFARSSTGVVPLPAPASVEGGVLYVPLAVVADVFPRVASGLLYDASLTEVRVFTALLSAGRPAGAVRRRNSGSDVPIGGATIDPGPVGTTVGSGASANRGSRLGDAETSGVAPSGDILLPESGEEPTRGEPSVLSRRHLVVVDAGHGGPDHGMMGPMGGPHILYEKDVTLAVALKVGATLQRRGIDVIQTRTTDTLIALSDRGRIANDHKSDLFVSIHVNAANPSWHEPAAARGFETYFLAEAKTEDARRVERLENEAVRFETGANAPQHDPLNFIVDDMHQNEYLRESSELAETIQRRLGHIHPGPDRGVKQAGFRVLVTAFMPAVLVEIGFGTNAAEARFLNDPAQQSRIAAAIAGATVDYLARYERRVSAAAP